jgi:hypothetical protein
MKKPFYIHEPQAWAPMLQGQSTTYGTRLWRTLVCQGFFINPLVFIAQGVGKRSYGSVTF